FYLLSSIGANASRLFAVDPATGEQTLLAEDPVYDVKQVEMDPETYVPQAVVFAKDRDEWVFLDEGYAKDIAHIRGELALQGIDAEVYVDRDDRSGERWTVSVVTCAGPVLYYVYQRADGRMRFLFTHQPELERYRLARPEPFELTARDGIT